MNITIVFTIALIFAGSFKEEEKQEKEEQECMASTSSFNKSLEEEIEANGGSCVGLEFKGEPENKYKFACKVDFNEKPNACCVTRESTELERYAMKTYVRC